MVALQEMQVQERGLVDLLPFDALISLQATLHLLFEADWALSMVVVEEEAASSCGQPFAMHVRSSTTQAELASACVQVPPVRSFGRSVVHIPSSRKTR